jgi:hypothetical protein
MSEISRSEHYPYSGNRYTRCRRQSFDVVSAIKSALFNALGFILLGVVLLVTFLIAMASASRVVQTSSHSTSSAQLYIEGR